MTSADLLGGVVTIVGHATLRSHQKDGSVSAQETELSAIPYYAWANRGQGDMSVWLAARGDAVTVLPTPTVASESRVTVSFGDHDAGTAFSDVGLQHDRVRQIVHGQKVLYRSKPDFRGEIVAHHRVNSFSAVPTVYASLLQVPVGSNDVRTLDHGLCGAAPMPTEVFRAFEERTGITILEGYGLTEGTCVSSLNPPGGERRVGSIGLRLPGQAMKAVVLDAKGGFVRDCEVDEVGTIVVSGPNVFLGYRDPAQDRELWVDCGDGRRWLNTGDLGRQDAEGYFWLTGRRKELIIRGGHNIAPAAIEEPLHRHPAVAVAAAVGRPDAHAGELPVAYVQPKPGAAVTEAELIAFLGREIGERAAVPKRVHLVSGMPMTSVGKIFKPELRRREAKDALETALREAGVEIFGQEQLKRYRVRTGPSRIAMSVASGIDWFDLTLELSFEGTPASLEAFVTAVQEGKRFVKLTDGSYGMLPEQWLRRFPEGRSLGVILTGVA